MKSTNMTDYRTMKKNTTINSESLRVPNQNQFLYPRKQIHRQCRLVKVVLGIVLVGLATGVVQAQTATEPAFVNGIGAWGEPGSVPKSAYYHLGVNGIPIQCHKRSDAAGNYEVDTARFATTGSWTASLTNNAAITSYDIRPHSRGISATVNGNVLTFSVSGPDKLYVTLNSNPSIVISATPRLTLPTGNVVVIAAGDQTNVITPAQGQTIWLNPSSILHGKIADTRASLVRVAGYGTLDLTASTGLGLDFYQANNCTAEGFLVVNSVSGWSCRAFGSGSPTFRDLTVLSFGSNGDGIDPTQSSSVLITNCFLRTYDDAISIKNNGSSSVTVNNINVAGCTMLTYMNGNGVVVGPENTGPIQNVIVDNCDILGSTGSDNYPSHSHGALGVINESNTISGVTFSNIRCENLNLRNNLEIAVANSAGSISTVKLINVNWDNNNSLYLTGFDSNHQVSGVTFQNCFIAGRYLNSGDPKLTTNYVNGVTFQ